MNPEARLNLEEEVATLRGLLGHKGWVEMVMPDLMKWQAAAMSEWLSDVGDKKGNNDLLRGQVIAYKRVLKHYNDRLVKLQEELDTARTGKPAENENADMPAI